MMEQSTQTNNIIEGLKKADQKALLYSLKRKIKKEHDREQDYIILQILKKSEKESDYNIMQKTMFKLVLLFNFTFC